jgi:hypothetical protein
MIYKISCLFLFSAFTLFSCKVGKGCDCPTWGKHLENEGLAQPKPGYKRTKSVAGLN